MSSDRFNVAILGSGMIAEFHKAAIEANAHKGARLIAMAHYVPDRFHQIAERYGVPCKTFGDVLSDPDVDAICIATPSGQHGDQMIAAAEAGKHVMVEKPMALSLAACDKAIETASAHHARLSVALQRRAMPLFQNVKKAVDGGDLGRVTLGSVTIPYHRGQAYYDQAAWRGTWALDGGGVLMNQGIHLIDLLIWFMGDPINATATGATLQRDVEVEDTIVATFEFDGGARATVTATTTTEPGMPHRIELYGTKGGIQLEGENPVRWTLADPDRATVPVPELIRSDEAGAAADPSAISADGHIAILSDLIDAVREDREPKINGAEGRRSLAAVLKIYEAAGIGPGR